MALKFNKRVMKDIYMLPGIPEIRYVFDKNDLDIKIVGGTVRDIILGKTPNDIDIATPATPCQMTDIFVKEKISHFYKPKSSNKYTVTACIRGQNYECTTLQYDKTADTEKITHQFRDWELDANIRDFTINAVYLDFDGTIYDYCNGIEHIKKRHIQFIGDPVDRMKEDYIRILRYFRFFSDISSSASHNETVINCIKENVQGLEEIAGQRIYVELNKILVSRWAYETVNKMKECGIFQYIGLTDNFDMHNFNKAIKNSDMEPLGLLGAGLTSTDDVAEFCRRLNISRKDTNSLFNIVESRDGNVPFDKATEEQLS